MTDFYKVSHIEQYPKNTTEIYSYFSARSDKYAKKFNGETRLVFFGLNYFFEKYLYEAWKYFFKYPEECINEYKEMAKVALNKSISVDHFEKLAKLGFLPIELKSLPEFSMVPLNVPFITVRNTLPEFFWLTNYIETVISMFLWKPITVATIAYEIRSLLNYYNFITGGNPKTLDFQGHDFSARGMANIEDNGSSAAAHLLSFSGTDSLLGIKFLYEYYPYKFPPGSFVGGTVPATEHSVMCMSNKTGEFELFKRLITETYPNGIFSIVSDTWDLWKVLTDYLPKLKEIILNRDGKVVIRPDSGDPLKIICGDITQPKNSVEFKGCLRLLEEVFGVSYNERGYKMLAPQIGLIYGDSMNLSSIEEILATMRNLGYCSDNVIFGIGSYTYQYITRDTYSFAMKASHGKIGKENIELYKKPITDDGTKYSLRGYLKVIKTIEDYEVVDQQSFEESQKGELKTVFLNGKFYNGST